MWKLVIVKKKKEIRGTEFNYYLHEMREYNGF